MSALLESPPPLSPPPEERERRRRRGTFWAVVAASLGFHALLALLAGVWIVSRAWHRPVVVFTAHRPPPALPAEDEGGQSGGGVATATTGGAPDASAYIPPPPASESIAGPLPQALPDLALPSASLDPAPPTPLASAGATLGSGSGAAPAGAGTGNAGEGSGTGDGLSFFGLQEEARRVVIALDVSYSMFVRQPGAFDQIVAETGRAIARLGPDASFDLLVFEDGSLAWKPALVPATDANRQSGAEWLATIAKLGHHFSARAEAGAGHGTVLFEGGGTRGDTALRQAFSLRPDLIVILTDGQWQENELSGFQRVIGTPELAALTAELQKTAEPPVRIDVVFLSTARTAPGESAAAQALAEGNGGHLIEIKGADLVKAAP